MNTSKGFGLIGVLVILAILAAGRGYYFYSKNGVSAPATSTATTTESSSNDTTRVAQVSWVIEDITDGTMDVPKSKVSIRFEGAAPRLVGTYDGSCAEIAGSSWTLLPGEKSGVICYYAGGGNEVGVFEVDGKLVVKEGVLDEGSAEVAGTRATTKTLFQLN